MSYKKIIPYINGENELAANVVMQAEQYCFAGADALFLYNYSKIEAEREEFLATLKEVAEKIDIPFMAGMYMERFEDAKKVFYTGAEKIVVKYDLVKDDSLLKEMIARFGSDKILVEVDADIDFDKIPLHVDTFLVKHVDIDAEFERKMMRAGKQIIIRDSLLRNDLENLLKLEKVEGVSTNYYLGKELFKIKKAMKEAKGFGEVVEVASSAEATYTYIPKDYTIPADADYFHITTNNTIYGTELKEDLNSPVPMVADMSSDIFSRPVDVSKYICIYGGAQKNLAPAGVTFVIVKNDAVGKVSRYIPSMLNYQTHIDNGSMFNTPPVVPIYAALLNLRWIKAQGGVKEMERRAIEKADMLYAEIDRNKLFVGTAAKEDRSRMNICFVMAPEYKDLEADFLKFATERGMVGIKGHRSVGGFRASCYNALPKESVQALIDCMQEFEKLH